jgi:molecular chaperone DnaJ
MDVRPDYYAILGLKKDASTEEVRRAYRKLAIKFHPDRNPGDKGAEAKFKDISAAYDVLSDPVKRKKYEDLKFAPPSAPPPNYPVADVSVEVELTARDLEHGADKTVTVSRPRTCPDCSGTGRINRRFQTTCQLCGGTGCQPCEWTGRVTFCARCWGSGGDREMTLITVRVPPRTPPSGRQKLVANGDLWGLRGPFYVYANVVFKVQKPGLIVR